MHPNAHPYYGKARLTVYLDRIVENWKRLSAAAAPAGCAAVVKADGYGIGATDVAEALYLAGCRFFYVATLQEALPLRSVMPEAEIAVLHGPQGADLSLYLTHRLMPVINHAGQWQDWLSFLHRNGESFPCLLHVDTGMNRLGFNAGDFIRLWQEQYFSDAPIRMVMSHLACPDSPDHPKNRQQLAQARRVQAVLGVTPFSLSSSAGIYLGPEYRFDQVRAGGSLYGNNPVPGMVNPLINAVDLDAPLVQIRHIAEEGTVGYGATCTVAPASVIGVIPVGYADGYPRLMQEGKATVHLTDGRQVEVPIAGRISMDSICLDLSTIGIEHIETIACVELLGDHQPLDAVAKRAGTIGYEILTRLGNRFERCYVGRDKIQREETQREEEAKS